MDVLLLGKATTRFFKSLLDNVKSHPIDVGKFTISSFAFNAVQLHLYRSKKQACFSPDFKPLYHAIRSSCLGGLCMVARHKCTGDPDDPPINSHLTGGVNLGKTLAYYDENSLYGSAVSYFFDTSIYLIIL